MINEELIEILEKQKALLCEDKRLLGLLKSTECSNRDDRETDVRDLEEKSGYVDGAREEDENLNFPLKSDEVAGEDKENFDYGNVSNEKRENRQEETLEQNPVIKLDLSYLDYDEKKKRDFIDSVANLESPFMSRSNDRRIAMLRCGEYSPNNPELRVNAKPFLGIGEYEQQQSLIRERLRSEYLNNGALRPKSKKGEILRDIQRNILPEKYSPKFSRSVQTDIQNIHCPLIQYDRQNPNEAQKELSPQRAHARTAHFDTSTTTNNPELTSYRGEANDSYRSDACGNGCVTAADMDKPKGILTNRKTGSPRDRYLSNLKHSYTPSFMDGFSYSDRTEELERERKKRETYNYELRMQIEEKRRLQAIKDEQDRREQELENKRLEQQLLRMQEEALVDDPKSSREEQVRRHSDDYMRRRMDLGLRSGYRRHTDSESSVLGTTRNALAHYSPPVSRRNHYTAGSSYNTEPTLASRYNSHSPRYDFDARCRRDALDRMDSLNAPPYGSACDGYDAPRSRRDAFARFDSLSRIDSLGTAFESMGMREERVRRHSATQQDLAGPRRSPRLQRRSNSGRFMDDQLPIPVLKARSPVARELKNSVPFNSSGVGGARSSEACRRLEDKWQIPAVQKNIVNHSDSLRDGSNRSILTQLGAIRMQLQQEQLRMDETLRKRGITQSKAVDFH